MTRYAERDDLVDAVQWRPGVHHPALTGCHVATPEGLVQIRAGWWIVTDQWGDVSVLHPSDFQAQYVRVLDARTDH